MSKIKEGLVISHPKLGKGSYLVVEFKEQHPHITFGNRSSSYENVILLQKLNNEYEYDENAPIIKATSCNVYSEQYYKYLNEDEINIVSHMKKTWVDYD